MARNFSSMTTFSFEGNGKHDPGIYAPDPLYRGRFILIGSVEGYAVEHTCEYCGTQVDFAISNCKNCGAPRINNTSARFKNRG